MRLIDADALRQQKVISPEQAGGYPVVLINDIWDAPTIDAVQVVRCKGCQQFERYAEAVHQGSCNSPQWTKMGYDTFTVNETDFCSYGDPREVAND